MISSDERIEIIKADNGYIVTHTYIEDTQPNGINIMAQDTTVIEGDTDKEALKKMLEAVAEYSGVMYDKYGKENLRISFDKKGHKIDDENETAL
jgi:ribulose bisphosphate carboxylase small subunit